MRRYRATIVAGIAVALVVVVSFVLVGRAMLAGTGGTLVARVHDGDATVHEFSLAEDGDYVITTSLGTNTIRIENGTVRMAEADCPNQSCLQQEPLSHPGPQIICLPHKLWVEVVSAGDKDAGTLNEDLVAWSDEQTSGDASTTVLDDLDTVAR